MSLPLLNEHQARHLSSVLTLLLDELARLGGGLPHEAWAGPARAQIQEIESLVRALLKKLDLRLPSATRPRARVQAYAGAWLARLHDLHAGNLSGYGAVAPGLAAELDPALDQIARAFERLARSAGKGEEP